MADPDRLLALRIEKLRSAWEHDVAEVDLHKQRYIALLAILVTIGLTALASTVLEKVDASVGAGFAGLMFGGAGYMHLRLRTLPLRLKAAARARNRAIDKLIEEETR